MRDWDTRINTLKSDIQAAREKYVIPFMKAKPKPAPPQKEVSQTPSQTPEENKVETSAESKTEKLYENKDPTSSLDLIDKTNGARNETNLGLTEEITNKIDSALEQTKPEEEAPTVNVEEAVASAEEAPTVNVEEAVASAEEAPTVNVEEAVASAEEVQKLEEIKVNDENIEEKEDGVDKNQNQKSELELLEERDENSLTEEEEDRMYELRRLRAQKRINDEVREDEQAEFKKADEEIAHLKTLLKPKKKKLPKGYVE